MLISYEITRNIGKRRRSVNFYQVRSPKGILTIGNSKGEVHSLMQRSGYKRIGTDKATGITSWKRA